MSTEPDEAFIRNYFACYKLDSNSSDLSYIPTQPGHNLEDFRCTLNCCRRFSLDARLLLRTAYKRLTPEGRVAFLAAHVRGSTSPGQAQYRLPTAGNGLEKVCEEHFLNTLQETRVQVRRVMAGKRKSALDSEEIVSEKRINRDRQRTVADADVNEDVVEEIEPEIEETEQLILPDGSESEEVSKSHNDPLEHEPVDIKTILTSDDESVQQELLNDPEAENDESRREALLYKKIEDNLRRERKVRGLSYTSETGWIVPARAVKPNCGPTCLLQCTTRLSEEVRQELLANLLLLSQSNQRKFIAEHVCVMPAARPVLFSSRRTFTSHFFLPVGSQLVKVCKTMFANTYDLSMRVLRTILDKKVGGKHVVCGNPNFPSLLKKKKGKFYFEYDEGCDQAVAVPPKVQKCKCDLQCGTTFPEQVIERIQSSYMKKSKEEQRNFLSEHVQLVPGRRERYKTVFKRARFYLPLGSTVQEVCRTMFLRTFKLNSTQVNSLLNNLPKNPDSSDKVGAPFEFAVIDADLRMDMPSSFNLLDGNGLEEKILPDLDEESRPPSDPVKQEPVDIKVEANELDADHDEFMIILPRDDDSVNEELPFVPAAGDDEGSFSGTDSQEEIYSSGEEEGGSILTQKERKIRGLSYISRSGIQNPRRTLQPNCGDTCHSQCCTRVSEEMRQELLTMLLQKSQAEQRKFLADHICNIPSTRSSLTGRQFNHYFLPVESRLVKVCKTMFMNTYDLSDKKIRIIIAKKSGAKHAVCGNLNFPMLLKKSGRFYFDYDVSQEQPPEVCKCIHFCVSKFTEEVIEQIQQSFREKSKKEQDEFFSKHIQLVNDKRNHKKNPLSQARYFLPHGSSEQEVCRRMFQHAFKLHTDHVRALVDIQPLPLDPLEMAKEHIAGHRMEEDHHCAVSGNLRKLSHSPNLARMYSEYLEGCRRGVEPIDYRQYFGEFCRHFAKTGLLRLTSCPDCGYFDRGEVG